MIWVVAGFVVAMCVTIAQAGHADAAHWWLAVVLLDVLIVAVAAYERRRA